LQHCGYELLQRHLQLLRLCARQSRSGQLAVDRCRPIRSSASHSPSMICSLCQIFGDSLSSSPSHRDVYISLDAAAMAKHEANRGLKGLGVRIRSATIRMPALGVTPLAQVTTSRLIEDYHALLPLLQELGFVAGAFSGSGNSYRHLSIVAFEWKADR
jgi:hypothetical protein